MQKTNATIEGCQGAAVRLVFDSPNDLRAMRMLHRWIVRDHGKDIKLTPVAMKMHTSCARCAGGAGLRAVVRFVEVETVEKAEALIGRCVRGA